MNHITLGEDGERRFVAIRILHDEKVVVLEAWACSEGWKRMATPFDHMGRALKFIEERYD